MLCCCAKYDNPVNTISQGKFDITYGVDFTIADQTGKIFNLPDSLCDTKDISLTITDLETNSSHTWSDISEFSSLESFRPGKYKVRLNAQSDRGQITFSADTVLYLSSTTTRLNLTLKPDIIWVSNTFELDSQYELESIVFHSLSDGSVDSATISRPDIFIKPGMTEVIISFKNNEGKIIGMAPWSPLPFDAPCRYDFRAELKAEKFTYNSSGVEPDYSITLSDSFFNNDSPIITTSGFEANETITAVEGMTLSAPVVMTAESPSPFKHLYFRIESPLVNLLNGSTETFELDFMNLTDEQKEILSISNLQISLNENRTKAIIHFTKSIENLASLISARSIFTLTAINSVGLVSKPISLGVETKPVSFELVEVEKAVIGLDIARLKIRPSVETVEVSDLAFRTSDGYDCPIVSSLNAGGLLQLDISIPEGINTQDVDLYFVGLKRTSFSVERQIPEFALFPDGYATSVRVRIVTKENKTAQALTRLLLFKINTGDVSVLERDTTDCTVILNGLLPETDYRLNAGLTSSVSIKSVKFTTEKAAPVPDGDFEDVDPLITFKHLPSGGRYALTFLDLINRQNYVDVSVYWPKKNWTSINARTFYTDSRTKNTWYMQPSAEIAWEGASGTKCIMIKSVGWDPDGESIPDWVPEAGTGTARFSGAVPKVSHRSAGRLFLGKYSFNPSTMTEIYNEGVTFSSRPSSLNGFYKYTPDRQKRDDHGKVTIELVRRDETTAETVIASGEYVFGSCPDFKAFNVPLDYFRYDLHPTHLKIMFLSSVEADEVPIDDINVPVSPNTESGAYIGSILWVDNLSFAY